MNCRECNELLPLYADHTLTPDEEKAPPDRSESS